MDAQDSYVSKSDHHKFWRCIIQHMNNWEVHIFYFSAVLNLVKPIENTSCDVGNHHTKHSMPGLHLHKTTPKHTSMPSKITNKNKTASTRSQLNVPRKCDLILATPKADVNFSAHTRKRCCITGPRMKRSIILH